MQIRLLTYLKFLLKSSNQHGVHSPFVFSYLTKCLYKKPRKSKDKTLDVALKSIDYFGFKNVKVIGNTAFEKDIKTFFPNLIFDTPKIDFLYLDTPQSVDIETIFYKYELHNETLIMINNINKSSELYIEWVPIREHNEVSVSINTFYCGLAFVRKEQQKEHFNLRI